MKHHVTVGVDGSPESLAAARWGAREASLRQVPLRLVHAVDWPTSPAVPRPGHEAADRWADEALAVEATDAELLVLGSRGLGGLVGFLIGSVTMATLAATETPVALVRAGEETTDAGSAEYGEIVVGVDIHEAADQVLSFAFEEASRRACALWAVHGWKLPPAFTYVPFFDADNERDIGLSVTQMLDDTLLPWRHKFPSVSVTRTAFMGAAGPQLVQASVGADLVVVGRHLRRSPLGAHLGPVAHAVLHHAAAPVAVITHD